MKMRAVSLGLVLLFALSCEDESSPPQPEPQPPPDKVGEARAMIAKLEVALESFKADYGQDPWPEESLPILHSRDVIRELMPKDPRIWNGADPTINVGQTTYLHDVPSYYISDGTLVDPWGNEYLFAYSPSPEAVLIYSFGPDCRDGGADPWSDDISNLQ